MPAELTDKQIQNLKSTDRRREIPDGKLRQLYCIVQPSGAVSFAVRYRYAEKSRKHTLGSYPELSLKDARTLARQALGDVAKGIDPAREKQKTVTAARAIANTDIKSTVDQFIDRYGKSNLKERTAVDYKRLFEKHIIPGWGHRPVQSITRRDIVRMLDCVIDGGAPVGANRVFAALRRMLNWCVERGIIEVSPAAAVTAPTAESARDRVLDDEELSLVMAAADGLGWPFAPFVHVLALTGQRRDEVASMQWPEVDFERELWKIPASRVKNSRAHEVPLSPQVIEILANLPRIQNVRSEPDYIFTTTGRTPISGFSRAKRMIDASILKARQERARQAGETIADVKPLPDWRFHDLRRTMASGMARLGAQIHVVEKILNHTSGTFGGIVGVYQRHDFAEEKRAALLLWGRHIARLASAGNCETKVGNLGYEHESQGKQAQS